MRAEHLRTALLAAGVWLLALLVLLSLFLTSACVPNSALQANMEKSALYYADKDAFSSTNGNRLFSVADHYADSILLGVSYQMGNGNPLVGALDTKYYDGGEAGEAYGLYLSVTEGAAPNTDYTRYFHGTAIFVRLFHLFTDVAGVKAIGFSLLLLLIAGTAAVLILKKHADLALLLALSLSAVQVWQVRLSMEYQPSFLIAMALCMAFLLLEGRGNRPLILLSAVGGTAVAFFDFLTTETLTLLLPLLLVIAVREKEGRLGDLRRGVRLSLACGGAWLGTYAATFLAKWTLATAVTGQNAFRAALSFAGERFVGETEATSFLSPLLSNVGAMFGATGRADPIAAILAPAILALIMLAVWYLFRREGGGGAAPVLLLLLGATVLLRFLVLGNHAYLHCFFTYRALASTVFAALAALWLSVRPKQGKRGLR